MTSTATKPSASGSAAAASEPKTSRRMSRTSGNPAVSALARSSFESSCIAAQSAPWPTSEVVTPSRAPSPAPRFSRRSTARSVAASSSTATRSGTTTVPPAAARRSASARVAAGSATPSTGATPSPTRATAARSCAGVAPGSGISTAASCARGTPGKPVERLVDGGRRRAGDAEAAAREVLGLAGGERERGEQDRPPTRSGRAAGGGGGGGRGGASRSARGGRSLGRRKLAGWPAKVHDMRRCAPVAPGERQRRH